MNIAFVMFGQITGRAKADSLKLRCNSIELSPQIVQIIDQSLHPLAFGNHLEQPL